jgi:hypothetical protein
MTPPGSTLIGHPGGGGLLEVAAEIMGAGAAPHEEVAALLLPMVRRAVRGARGPAALISWLRHRPAPAVRRPEPTARLAEDLARLLSDAAGSPADTLADT